MTVSQEQNSIPSLSTYTTYENTDDTRIQIVEGEMYEIDNRLCYIEDQLQELHDLLDHIHELICSDVAGNRHNTEATVDPPIINNNTLIEPRDFCRMPMV